MHFLVGGLALFAGVRLLNRHPDVPQDTRIELTEDDLRQLTVSWAAQGRPPPTPEQLASLVDAKVREEILYREALALGLDKGDTIIRRRLAQKMEFLFEDVAALHDPSADELQTWFGKNSERFALPPRISFRHLYFSPDRRGEHARQDAERTLEKLAGNPENTSAARADPFMFQDAYADRSPEQLFGVFGPPFVRALLQLQPGAWRGPVESGYGWHLVFVEELTPSRLPAFEEVESDVRSAWVEEQRAAVKRRAFQEMRTRYQVVLPTPRGTP